MTNVQFTMYIAAVNADEQYWKWAIRGIQQKPPGLFIIKGFRRAKSGKNGMRNCTPDCPVAYVQPIRSFSWAGPATDKPDNIVAGLFGDII